MSIHEAVVNLLVSLGYTKIEGCCHGFSLRWLEACLLDEEELFDARIKRINSNGGALGYSIHAVKEKKGQHLTADDKELLDILAFYDSLELYQSPRVHFSLFNASLMQNDVDLISNMASSDAILSRGGLTRIYSEPGIYTKNEIKVYFDELGIVIEKACAQYKSKESLGVVLSSCNHSIALTYTPGKGWTFMDINQYPSKLFAINKTDLLSECIMTGFFQSNSPYRAFNVSVFTTAYHLGLLNLKEAFASFNTSHIVTKEMAHREVEGVGLARIAAQNGHASVFAELAKHGINLNQAVSHGVTPAYIAAQNGHASVIAELAKYGVDLTQAISNGGTPAFIAAQYGHVAVIAELAKHGVDLNEAISKGATPAYIAAQDGHVAVIAELAKHGVDLNQAISNGATPTYIAAQNGHASVIAELAKHGADLNKANSNGITPVYIAAHNGHASVIAELAKYGVDLNQPIRNGKIPAFIAAQNGHASVIAELAKHGVNLNQAMSNGEGVTPAFIAAYQGHALVIAELAKHGVDLNQKLSNGKALAFIAAQEGHVSMIAVLIKIGVNFNAPYTASVASLRQFAISRGDKIIERMNDFIAQQLSLSSTRHTLSMTAYHIAMIMGHHEIMQLLNTKEEQAQNKRWHASHQLMKHTQRTHNKTIRDGHPFFKEASNEAINPPQRGRSYAYQESVKKRKLGALDDEVISEHDQKRTRYPLLQ